MLITSGLHYKKFLGITRRVKLPSFHDKFGSTTVSIPDFDVNPHVHESFNQNIPNTLFGTPAQPEGCTGMALSSVCESVFKIPINPYFPYQQICLAEGVPVGSPCQLDYVLNEPVITGELTLGETLPTQALARKTAPWWGVTPLNGSLFQGILSALSVGQTSVSYAGTWYESYDSPQDGIVPVGSGQTSGHNWVFSGQKTVNGVSYLIAESFLGSDWGGSESIGLAGGFCLFSEAELNANNGQAFTPKESPSADSPVSPTIETILESLLHFLQTLVSGIGSTQPFSVWNELEDEIQAISRQIPKTMEENIYNVAKENLGKHITLNPVVPAETGCAEAVSFVLSHAGIAMPAEGIAGTASLYEWLVASPLFTKIDAPEEGAVIISPTGSGNGLVEGHTGICGAFNTQFQNDYGILSNDSASGLFLETWSWQRWNAYYGGAGGLPVHVFRPI